MATRDGEFGYDQLHHFVAEGVWESAPFEAFLLKEADHLVGDEGAFLIIDDTALPKKGNHSVGVAAQYASSLGKTANCQSLVSVTLASREVPVMVGLRLFQPESWTGDAGRMERARAAGRCARMDGSMPISPLISSTVRTRCSCRRTSSSPPRSMAASMATRR